MAASGGNQGVGLRRFALVALKNTNCGSASECSALKAPGSPKYDGANFLQHPHRTDVSWPQVQDHDLFRVNTQVHDSCLRQLGLRRGHVERQQT